MGRALLERMISQQAAIIAYANDFKLLMFLTLATLPLIVLIGSSRARPGQTSEAAAHEM
jgi:DHA2 family multidrug resistance protein